MSDMADEDYDLPDPSTIDFNDPRWVSVQEAAHIATVSERTIRIWVKERGIAVLLPSGRYRIDRAKLFRHI
ncbi:helix-turn-helix domain-containing protein [Brucella anthropi]|nr:helix-turn-helix domain-containing protein [Brucella anthropi]